MVAGSCVVLGVLAHVVTGGRMDFSCAPLVVSAFCAAVATLIADHVGGYERRLSGGLVGLVALGQLLAHVELTKSLLGETRSDTGVWGLTCRLVIAHAVAVGLLIVLILAAQRLFDLPLVLVERARAWLWNQLLMGVVTPDRESISASVTVRATAILGSWTEPFVARVLCRRGPPTLVVS